jgi:AcrR family transcriptional regulator
MLFWRRGYEATSIGDLVEAIGINRGSLYATFGDKRRLFLASLERYIRTIGAALFAELEGTTRAVRWRHVCRNNRAEQRFPNFPAVV